MSEYGLNAGVDFYELILSKDDEFWEIYHIAERKVLFLSAQCRLRRNARIKAGKAAVYVIPASVKQEIHHHINQIRELISQAEMSPQKQEALAAKVNAFAEEVDRDRTRVEILTAAYIWAKREAKEELAPAIKKIEKIFEVLGKAQELWETLPKPDLSGELAAPPKRISAKNDTSDDDIPF